MPAAPSRLLLVAAFGALYFIWGSTYLAIRFGVESWPPLLMAGIRFVIAGGLMFGWLRWRGTPLPSRGEWTGAARIGFLLLVCGNGCVTIAEQWVASGVAALGVATVPLLILTHLHADHAGGMRGVILRRKARRWRRSSVRR